MKKYLLFTVMLFGLMASSRAQEWQRLSAVIMTPWGEQIDPENVWQEYPRPQMVRADWMNLNGVWEYFRRTNRISLTAERTPTNFKQRILVPFGVESALSGIKHTDYATVAKSTLMYRRTFELTDAFQGKRVLLHFGAVDWRCAVFVNQEKVGEHQGGSDPFTFDITDYLTDSGEQELQVAVYDPCSLGGQPRGKQTTNPGGIWYTSCSGIWQTVWLEPVSASHIERYELIPDAESGTITIKVLATDHTCGATVTVLEGETPIAVQGVPVGEAFPIKVPNPKLWTPDTPYLYNIDITLTNSDGETCDKVRGYFGLRTLTKGMVDGHPAFLLNGEPLFMYGPLDQGWWPDGLLTPPSYDAMVYDLQTIKDLGMNMVRKHIKVENDLWYEWCDRHGLIVWQDMPSSGEGGNQGTKDELQNIFYEECEHIVNAVKQHPSICVWIPYNEAWGQYSSDGSGHTMRGYLVVRNADADMGRLMDAASGWTDFEIGDITDAHSYPSPNGMTNERNDRVNVCGEFGGITYLIDDHLWAGSQQVYTSVDSSNDYTDRFNQYTSVLQSLQKTKGLWGGVYTQITDVEQEVNGILTYDRKVLKVNAEQQASIRRHIERTIHQRLADAVSVVPAGDNAANISWRYTTIAPADGWEQSDFDDTSWKRGAAGFGSITQPDARVRTTWNTPEIWLRRTFRLQDVTSENLQDLCLRIFYDEDSEVYINGVLALTVKGYITTYQLLEINEEALHALHLEGDNVIAIHTLQTSGGQYIDAGFSLRTYQDNSELIVQPFAELDLPKAMEDLEKAYLMCYSKANDPSMFYAYSLDGLEWRTIYDGLSVFGASHGQTALTHPFIRKIENGETGDPTFHLVYGGTSEAPGLYHWTSPDLITWQPLLGEDGKITDTEVLSPEIDYDTLLGYYVYYWSVSSDDTYVPQYIRTKDFTTFSRAATFFTSGTSVCDLHTFKAGDWYVGLYTDPVGQGLCTAVSRYINPARSRFQNFKKVFPGSRKITNPTVYPSFDGNGWFLMGTEDNHRLLFCAATAEASNILWRAYEAGSCVVPSDADGGKVLVITRQELYNLLEAYDQINNGISAQPDVTSPDAPIYNLQGQRVTHAERPGIYISKGKKRIQQITKQ